MSVYHQSNRRNGHAARGAAFYDLDGTLMGLNLIHGTLFAFTNIGEWTGRVSYVLGLAARLPMLYLAERRDRHLLNVTLFEMFKGISRDRLMTLGEESDEGLFHFQLLMRLNVQGSGDGIGE